MTESFRKLDFKLDSCIYVQVEVSYLRMVQLNLFLALFGVIFTTCPN